MVAISQKKPDEAFTSGVLSIGRLHPSDRIGALGAVSPAARTRLEHFLGLAKRGLPQMEADGLYAHTVRRVLEGGHVSVKAEGDSLRYAINTALGLSYLDEAEQRQILEGRTAHDLVRQCADRALHSPDHGAVALAAWTAAEASGLFTEALFARLLKHLQSRGPVETVDCSWTLIAAVAGSLYGDTSELTKLARDRLLEGQGPYGLFPHHLPASASGRLRAHIGCFADQVYSTQGLSRLYVATQDDVALAAANASGGAICRLQGPLGQWWWHYDTRNGTVVEGYPVYSVHQHAMGPMALLDLREAGGDDHLKSLALGLRWIDGPNEAGQSMVDDDNNVIWRKVARREPKKLVRGVNAVTTSVLPRLKVPGLDTIFPPGLIDYECRPYELGWMLYAWLGGGSVLRHGAAQPAGRS